MRPTDSEEDVDRRPQPDGDIEVIERATSDGDEQEWTVSLRWRTPADESAGRLGSGDD